MLIFPWSLIKLGRIITSRIKPALKDKMDTCYLFTCNCQEHYIGQACRLLQTRIREQGQTSGPTHVQTHIRQCNEYINEKTNYCSNSNISSRQSSHNILLEHSEVLGRDFLEKNLRTTYEATKIKKLNSTLSKHTDFYFYQQLNLF